MHYLGEHQLLLKARESGPSIGIPFDLCTWVLTFVFAAGSQWVLKNIRTFKHTLQ